MTFERTQLVAIARAEREGLGRTIQYASPESWEQASACPGWWNRDVIAHMAAQDHVAAQLLGDEDPEELDAYRALLDGEPFTIDGFNAWVVNRRSGLAYREVLTHWGRAADLLLDRAADLSDETWNSKRVSWLAGDIGVPYLVQSRIVEWWLHGDDVRLGAGMEPRVQHWPIHVTNDLGIRMLPWALTRAGFAFRDMSLQVDLEGAGGGSWHWGLAPGEVPREDQKADAYVQGRALAFALVAGRRMDPGAFLDDGSLVIGGDEDLAGVILQHLRAYP